MIVYTDLSIAACPACRRPFHLVRGCPLPSGIASLKRWRAECPCGTVYGLAYRRNPVADDQRRADDVRHWRQVARLRRGAERAAAEAVARVLSGSTGWGE